MKEKISDIDGDRVLTQMEMSDKAWETVLEESDLDRFGFADWIAADPFRRERLDSLRRKQKP